MKHALALLFQGQDFLDTLAAVDAEKDDETQTPGPTIVFEGQKINVSTLGFPVLEVIGIQSIYNQGMAASKSSHGEGGDSAAKSAWHQVGLFWTQVGDDELVITRDLERLVRATRDTLWPSGDERITLTGIHAGPLVLQSEDYSALSPIKNKTGFVKGSETIVWVPTITV